MLLKPHSSAQTRRRRLHEKGGNVTLRPIFDNAFVGRRELSCFRLGFCVMKVAALRRPRRRNHGMIIGGKLRLLPVVAGMLGALSVAQSQAATAQPLSWDWGGGSTVGGSGRETVRFDTKYGKGQVIVSFTDRRLYFITQPGEAYSYPIAVPREQSRWQGVTSVTQKRENPSWTPTPTMVRENPRLPRWVPGGHPMNPLGVRALYLGSSMYRIHGTDAPWTIGSAVSKGCIRLYNQDVLDLYPRVSVGAKVVVTYDSFTNKAVSRGPAPPPTPAASVYGSKGGDTGSSGGTFFDLFGSDEPEEPAPPPRKRTTRSKAKSASIQ
jgi:lipoprotein-anchoring transpeptidase ErfK/SrfK